AGAPDRARRRTGPDRPDDRRRGAARHRSRGRSGRPRRTARRRRARPLRRATVERAGGPDRPGTQAGPGHGGHGGVPPRGHRRLHRRDTRRRHGLACGAARGGGPGGGVHVLSNLSWVEIVALLLLAVFIFGDKLPQVISDGLRLLRNLRRMARSATSDLSRELGTDIQLEDLNPKTFIRRHVLSDADQEALLKPLKGISEELRAQARGLEKDLKDIATE